MKKSFPIIRAVKQGCSGQWWSHSGPMRRPCLLLLLLLLLQCWTPVILRSPQNAPDHQTPETLWRKNQNSQNKTQPRRLTTMQNDPLRESHTCCNIAYVPNPQAFFLPSKSINEGQVRATGSTEQNALLTDGEIETSSPESDVDTAQVSFMCFFSPFSCPGNEPGWVCCSGCPIFWHVYQLMRWQDTL